MKEQNKNKTFYITHSGELLIWLIIIFLIISFSSVILTKNKITDNDYTIFMDDVDGLIVGSPVRAMGIEIGHITKIEPTNTEIYVKFIITDKNITIPRGTKATVEFSGMAGSKSLELYVPDNKTYIDNNVPIISVTPPKRLHDSASLLNEMLDKLGSIIYTSSSFTKKLNFIKIHELEDNQNVNDLVIYADKMVDNTTNKMKYFDKFKQKGDKNSELSKSKNNN